MIVCEEKLVLTYIPNVFLAAPTTQTPANNPTSNDSTTIGAVTGSIGGVAVFVIIIAIVVWLRTRKVDHALSFSLFLSHSFFLTLFF